jgi:glycosyltransferase involved in cell wall biosynthesis
MTRVSVVVPSFRNAGTIEATLDSILAQTHPDLELIVADHSSTDGTWEAIQRYGDDPRVTLLRTDAGGGAAANWRRVSEAATGEHLKLVCGDDLLHPEIVEVQSAALDSAPTATLVASRRTIVDADGRTVIEARGLGRLDGIHDGIDAVRASIRAGTNLFGEPACVLMRRSTFQDAGGWDASHSYLIDQASYARVLERGDFIAIRQTLASFRVSAGQWSVALSREQSAQAATFHREFRARHPQRVSRLDVAIGDTAARVNSLGRRVVYAMLGSRMRSGS